MTGTTTLFGIPLLSPWANRMSLDTYSINGSLYALNRQLHNLRLDKNDLSIHGLVLFAPWTVADLEADENGARSRCLLDCSRRPDWMSHFPFAHELVLIHELSAGRLTVRLQVTNTSAEAIPLSVGFHPYFTIPGGHRDNWKLQIPARTHMLLSEKLVPTGRTVPNDYSSVELAGQSIDDVFTDLDFGADNCCRFRVEDSGRAIDVGYGSKFPVAVVYAPKEKDLVCFEPMTAPSDAFRLFAEKLWNGMQFVESGRSWEESFWVEPHQQPDRSNAL